MRQIGFKFFLNEPIYRQLLDQPKIRRDRLLDRAIHVTWSEEKLKELLNKRVEYFSDQRFGGLSLLCDETAAVALEESIIQFSYHSPRRLLLSARELLRANYLNSPDSLAKMEHWQMALKKLMVSTPPILKIDFEEQGIYLPSGFVKLTPTESEIMKCLLEVGNGICDRDTLAHYAWKGTPNDGAIDKAISRLREKIDDNPKTPVYIETVPKEGFRLKYCEPII